MKEVINFLHYSRQDGEVLSTQARFMVLRMFMKGMLSTQFSLHDASTQIGVPSNRLRQASNQLVKLGILEEEHVKTGCRGRPRVNYSFHSGFVKSLQKSEPKSLFGSAIRRLLLSPQDIDEIFIKDSKRKLLMATCLAYADEFGFVSNLTQKKLHVLTGIEPNSVRHHLKILGDEGFLSTLSSGIVLTRGVGSIASIYQLGWRFLRGVSEWHGFSSELWSSFRELYKQSEYKGFFVIEEKVAKKHALFHSLGPIIRLRLFGVGFGSSYLVGHKSLDRHEFTALLTFILRESIRLLNDQFTSLKGSSVEYKDKEWIAESLNVFDSTSFFKLDSKLIQRLFEQGEAASLSISTDELHRNLQKYGITVDADLPTYCFKLYIAMLILHMAVFLKMLITEICSREEIPLDFEHYRYVPIFSSFGSRVHKDYGFPVFHCRAISSVRRSL